MGAYHSPAIHVDGLDQFESEMKSGTRQRREKDEHRISELKSDSKTRGHACSGTGYSDGGRLQRPNVSLLPPRSPSR